MAVFKIAYRARARVNLSKIVKFRFGILLKMSPTFHVFLGILGNSGSRSGQLLEKK